MRTCLLLAIMCLALGSCQSDAGEMRSSIRQLEKQSSDSTQAILVETYMNYANTYPGDSTWTPRFLQRAARMERARFHYSAAIKLLYQAIREYYHHPETIDQVLLLHNIFQHDVQTPFLITTIEQAGRQAFPALAERWSATATPIEDQLINRQKAVYESAALQINYSAANELITASELYALLLPYAEQSPELLLSAAEITRGLGVYRHSLDLLDWVATRYPEHPQAAQALFLRAFTLDEQLHDTTAARKAYQLFLRKHPDHEFANDARMLLDQKSEVRD
jgi:tetratricopeptide (TPR) repeat protein